jgi:hypothetical protein
MTPTASLEATGGHNTETRRPHRQRRAAGPIPAVDATADQLAAHGIPIREISQTDEHPWWLCDCPTCTNIRKALGVGPDDWARICQVAGASYHEKLITGPDCWAIARAAIANTVAVDAREAAGTVLAGPAPDMVVVLDAFGTRPDGWVCTACFEGAHDGCNPRCTCPDRPCVEARVS